MTRTTWGYRSYCPQCGHEGVTQDAELRDDLTEWHEDSQHDGASVCYWEEEDDIPVDEFPADEDPETGGGAVSTTQKVLGGASR